MFHLTSAPVVGLAQADSWAQVVAHPKQHCVCVFSVRGELAHEFGREITELCLASELRTTLELHQFGEKLVAMCAEQSLELQFAAQLMFDEKIAMCSFNGVVYLRRAQKIGVILPAQPALQIIEGKLRGADTYVLGTGAALAYESHLQQILQTVDEADDFVTQFMSDILDAENASQVAVAYVNVTGDEAAVVTPAVAPVTEDKKKVSPLRIFSSVLQKVQQVTLPFFSRDVYVRQQGRKNMLKILVPLVIVAAVIVVGGLVFRSQQMAQMNVAEEITVPAAAELEEIKKIAAERPLEARQRSEALVGMLEGKISQLTQQKTAQKTVQKQLNTVRDYAQSISGQQQLNTLPTFFDLRLFQSDFLANHMDISKQTIFFSDPDKKQILALDTKTKQTTLLPLGQLDQLRDFTVSEKHVYLLGNGVSRFTLGTNTTPVKLKEADADTNPVTSIRNFSDYLYLLNPEKRNIFRYIVEDDDKLSSPAAWLKPDEKFDVTTAQSMAIDGEVWLSTKTGEIERLSAGRTAAFQISGLKEGFATPIHIFTAPEYENIYVLEPAKNRVVILKKDGLFLKEIISTTLASTTTLVADESQRVVYVLGGSLVYEVTF